MAKILIPQGGDQPPMVRNFDEFTVIGPSGRVLYSKKAHGTWVLGQENGVQKLTKHWSRGNRNDGQDLIPMCWMLFGAWMMALIVYMQ